MSDRAVAAALAAALAFATSYTVQRALAGSPTGAMATTHVAFYWRFGLAGLHAAIAAALVGFGTRDPAWWLGRPWVVWAVVLPAVAALVALR